MRESIFYQGASLKIKILSRIAEMNQFDTLMVSGLQLKLHN